MVYNMELGLRRAMSYGELYGGTDPSTDTGQPSLVGHRVNGDGLVDQSLHDVNGNVQLSAKQRCNSLSECPGVIPKSCKRNESASFWHKFGKKGKFGFSKLLSSASYRIGSNRSCESEHDVSEPPDGRYSSASFHSSKQLPDQTSEIYIRHTSRDSGFSSESASSLNGDRIPGVCGIHNLGNTCYINAILQCLGHIDVFVEYFAMNRHETEISSKRKTRRNEAFTSTGEVTEKLAKLLKSLWSLRYSVELSKEFREAVGNYGKQYKGSMQHDAQEFLLWLLDIVHEDLCKAPKKKFSKTLAVKRRKQYSEEELALMTLAAYTRSSGSFIQDVFQAQYRSSLTCPSCNKQSSTFDPFLCISLPIPQPKTKPYYVTVVYNTKQKESMKVGVKVAISGAIKNLKDEVSKLVDIPSDCLLVNRVYDNGDQHCLKDTESVSVAHVSDDSLFALQKPSDVILKAPRRSGVDFQSASNLLESDELRTDSVVVVVTNVEVRGNQCRRFGFPVTLRVARDVSFRDLQLLIRREMRQEIREAFNREAKRSKLAVGLRIVDARDGKEYLNADTESPLCLPSVLKAESSSEDKGFAHVCIIAEWESTRGEWCFAKFGRGFARVDPSVRIVDQEHARTQVVSLTECINLHTQVEELQCEASWKCPNCKTELQKATKTLSLWSLPDVLVFHLKRFQQGNKGKISTIVDFPLESLNMSSHLAQRSRLSPRIMRRYSSSKKLRYHPPPRQEDCVYDLVSVCNHVGPYITSGHYTAHCKNSVDGNWYVFDDTIAHSVCEEQVISKNAYLLFYQRRTTLSRTTSLSSLSSSSLHWSLRMLTPSTKRNLDLNLEETIAKLAEHEISCSTRS